MFTSLSLTVLLLVGCASGKPDVDTSLYDGKPIDTLSTKPPKETEQEAISRGDAALSIGNDLALYEYIRALSFENGEYKDRALYNIGRIHQSRGNLALAEKSIFIGYQAKSRQY